MPRMDAWRSAVSKEEGTNHTEEHGEHGGGMCSNGACCVFPLILAFMFGAMCRQLFSVLRTYFSGMPPYTVLLILLGGLFAYCVEVFPSLKHYDNCLKVSGKTLVHVSLPLLVFHSTFKTEMQTFKKSLNQVLFMGVTGYAISSLLTATAMPLLFGYSWSYYICIIFGIVVSCTDPLAVDDAVKVSGVSTDLVALMYGESIISGTMGMVCFKLIRLLFILSLDDSKRAYNEEITIFVVQCMFAPAFGSFAAMLTVFWVSRIYNDATLEITIVLSVLHLVYYTSELLRLPGVLTVLFFGLYISSSRVSISDTVENIMKKSFRVLTDIHNSVQFFYAGVFIINEDMSLLTPLVIFYDVLIWVVSNVNRAIMVFFVSPVLRRLGLGMSWEHALTVWIGGLDGSFNILLCMMATQDLSFISGMYPQVGLRKDEGFFQTAMTQIFLRQVFNTSITRFVLKSFGLRSIPKFHQMSLATAMRRLHVTRNQTINSLKSDRFMADAAFDIVDSETVTQDIFKHFKQRHLIKKGEVVPRALSVEVGQDSSNTNVLEDKSNRTEAIQMVLKAQKKTYREHFNRGLMSKEALQQLVEWADAAADHKGKFLDVRKVKEACQVRPVLKTLKRQVKVKLRQLYYQKVEVRGWLSWQQQVMQTLLSYGFHILDTVAILLAILFDVSSIGDNHLRHMFSNVIFVWNCIVVGLYGMISLGELLVMRLRFFKIVWHDITFAIVLMGLVDLLVMSAVGELHQLTGHPSYYGRLFIRLFFIVSRSIRLLGLVESVPWVLKKCMTLLEQRISSHLVVGFDICCAFVTGQVQVVRQLDSLVSDSKLRQQIKHTCNKHKLDIIRTLGTLALENPTIALSVKTRQAMRIVLNSQHDTVRQLKEEGAIQETDAKLLSKDLEERMKRLLNYPPLVEDDSLDSILRNLGWVQGDDKLFKYLKQHVEVSHLKENAIVAQQDSEDYNIYIIGSGVARMERMEGAFMVHVLNYLTSGNVMGEINFLAKTCRHKTVRCETSVTLLTLREEVLEEMLTLDWNPDLPPLLYRMWLVMAKRVAIRVIMEDPDNQGFGLEHILLQMYHAYLIDDRLGTAINIHADPSDVVILVHGYARDAFTRQPFQGPCFIPGNCFLLDLLPDQGLYTLVLVIPNQPVELEEYRINPARCRDEVDINVLATSTSITNAVGLEDVFRNLQTAPWREESSRDQHRHTRQMDQKEFNSSSGSSAGSVTSHQPSLPDHGRRLRSALSPMSFSNEMPEPPKSKSTKHAQKRKQEQQKQSQGQGSSHQEKAPVLSSSSPFSSTEEKPIKRDSHVPGGGARGIAVNFDGDLPSAQYIPTVNSPKTSAKNSSSASDDD